MYACMFCIFMYICIYTPSTQPFKAFPVSKFNSKPYKVIHKSYFYDFHYYLYLFDLYLCIYTPSNPNFQAFPVSKFNSETSFLYQLFKENPNIIVLKPGKLINEAMQDVHLCMYVCVYNFHSETQVPLLLFRRSTRSNPHSMFFDCRRRG